MKIFLLVLVFSASLINTSCNNAEGDKQLSDVITDTTKFTTIQWLDTMVNFGVVKKGEKVNVKFRCKNTGTYPLYITFVRPSCGCTVADYTKSAIAPGELGEVNAVFDSEKAPSTLVRKTIVVGANTKNESPHLVFSGEVKEITQLADSSKMK